MKRIQMTLLLAGLALAAETSASPSVTVSSFTQAEDRTVTVEYTLSGGPAVITLEVQTNSMSWASIGGSDLCRARGDVWKRVETGAGTITWRPGGDTVFPAFAAGDVRAVVKAWPTNDPPAYMVVDLTENAPERVLFYPDESFVPGGVLANTDYRISRILMRKIPAANVSWTMGSVNEGGSANETPHTVTLSDNYYLACFPLTQAQVRLVSGKDPADLSNFTIEGSMRPCDKISYFHARENDCNDNTSGGAAYQYPNPPHAGSFLGLMRARSGNLVDFDLPSEAQWEYACRAGTGDGYWNNGKPVSSLTDMPGRYNGNGGKGGAVHVSGKGWTIYAVGPTNGTAVVGSYAPNAWGIYDMHGNAFEWCLDWYGDDITGLNGAVNANGAKLADGTTDGEKRVRRGGYFLSTKDCRSASRSSSLPAAYSGSWTGFRPAAPAVAK